MRPNATFALVAALALTGCYPFVTGNRFDNRLCELDEDGDGNLKCEHVTDDGELVPGDCNDSDPRMSHLNQEIPYDGVDNDCTGSDLIDVDGDDFPGISREDYEALGERPWPVGARETVDCNDEDADIYPGAPEIFYDGVDQNCDGLCDYDADQDGFADRRQGQDNDCDLPATDCLDTDPDIFPGASGEVFYDGEDQDCDGVNDFDPDEDGYAWDGYQAEVGTFLERYGYDDTIIAYTECYDRVDSPLPETGPLPPESVNPDQAETYYNGVDDDCSDVSGPIDNDFDRDGDGFMPTAQRANFLNYVQRYVDYTRQDGVQPLRAAFQAEFGANRAAWEAYFDSHDNDCNDNDSSVFPGTMERLGDSVDQDCDGNANTSPLVFSDLEVDGLGGARLVRTDDHFVVLAPVASEVDYGDGPLDGQVVSISFPLDAMPSTRPSFDISPIAPSAGDLILAMGATSGTDGYFVGGGYTSGSTTRLRGVRTEPASDGAANYQPGSLSEGSMSSLNAHEQGELLNDTRTGSLTQVACDRDRIQYAQYTTTTMNRTVSNFEPTGSTADCFVLQSASGRSLLINEVATSGAVRSWTLGGGGFLNPASPSPFTAFNVAHASNHDDWVILGLRAGGLRLFRDPSTVRSVLAPRSTVQADAVFKGSTAYVVAIEPTGGDNRVWLSFGNPSGSMTEVAVPFRRDGASLRAESAAVEVQGDRVAIAITGVDSSGTEHIGWTFFEI